jgi:nucleotide-binding universal stress UspA family protein
MAQYQIRSILAATDLGESSDQVLRSAAAAAQVTGAALHVLHVLELDSSSGGSGESASFPERIGRAEAALQEQLRRVLPGEIVPASRRVENYAVDKAIRQYAGDVSADLIVLGPHRGREVGRRLLGSTADEVIRTAGIPCLLVRQPLTVPIHRLAVPTDFSDSAAGALDFVLAWTGQMAAPGGPAARGPEVRVFHVAWLESRSGSEDVLEPRLEREVEEARRRAGDARDVPLHPEVIREIDPVEAIVTYA